MKVLIPTNRNHDLEEILKTQIPELEIVFTTEKAEINNHLSDMDVFIPERYKVDKELLDLSPKLKLIHSGTGYSNIDLGQTKARGVLVATTPGVVAQSVAEHVFSYINEFYKKSAKLDHSMKEGKWPKEACKPYLELSGKTIGIIGLGEIGKRVAKIADGYGMSILVKRKRNVDGGLNIKLTGLEELYKSSDIVTVHVPLVPETKGMIDGNVFSAMKKTAYFINTARGDVVDEVALVQALEQGEIAGAGIDVFVNEPLPVDSLLRKAPNIYLTPHTAYYTKEALNRRFLAYCDNIKRLLDGTPIVNIV